MKDGSYAQAVGRLRSVLVDKTPAERAEIDQWREEVFARFQPMFSVGNVENVEEEEFRAFLMLKNNHHWSGLHRLGPMMCANMSVLRTSLATLLDEGRPIEDRLDEAVNAVKGLGNAVATAILLVAYPDGCGVWNKASEAGLKKLDLWPEFEWGERLGSRYAKVNGILTKLSRDLPTDLWTLDMLWGELEGPGSGGEGEGSRDADDGLGFGLERHLHEFLRDNWEEITLGREWEIYTEDQDPEKGYEYPCGVGRIDILARHRKEPRWLVIELKRGQTSDATVGQLLRYVGWVRTHMTGKSDTVQGLIIAREVDDNLRYAVSALPDVSVQTYRVHFHLDPVACPGLQVGTDTGDREKRT